MCVISTPVIVTETEVHALKSKGRGHCRSRVQRWRDIFAHIKPQPHSPHAHFPSGKQTELVHTSSHAILQRGLGKKCKIMQGICL